MKKTSRRKIVIMAVAAVLVLSACLVYRRPMTISQLYPLLTLDKCTQIRGYYTIGSQAGHSEFTVEQGSEEFQELCALFWKREYRRELWGLLPRGTRSHRIQPGDFRWEVYFYFDFIEFPDGSAGKTMLSFNSWYGELDLRFDGKRLSCRTSEQDAWAKEVLDVIS